MLLNADLMINNQLKAFSINSYAQDVNEMTHINLAAHARLLDTK